MIDPAVPVPPLRPVQVMEMPTREGEMSLVLHDPLGVSPDMAVSQPVAALLGLFDGKTSLRDIQSMIMRETQQLVPVEDLGSVVDQLDEALLFFSPKFRDFLAAYRQETVRPAAHAGTAYPETAEETTSFLADCYTYKTGPGALPVPRPFGTEPALKGLVAPHIDLTRGGPIYAQAYHRLASAPIPDRVLILGAAHFPLPRQFAIAAKSFETPLGMVPFDTAFQEAFTQNAGSDYREGEIFHRLDYTCEFQTLFLRDLYGEKVPKIVPVLCAPPLDEPSALETGEEEPTERYLENPMANEDVKRFIEAIRKTIAEIGGSTLILVSADLSHVGARFEDEITLTDEELKKLEAKDRAFLELLAAGDAEKFYKAAITDNNPTHICSIAPLYAMLKIQEGQGKVLAYGQSPEKEQEADALPQSVVSFAAVAFPK